MLYDAIHEAMRCDDDAVLLEELQQQNARTPIQLADDSSWWGMILVLAASYTKLWVIDWLLNHGLPITTMNGRGHTALWAAVQGHDADFVAWLLAQGAPCSDAVLLEAARSTPEILRLILAQTARSSINGRGHKGRTPLMQAVMAESHANVQLLLDAGADPHQQTTYGMTAFDIARKRRCADLAERLAAAMQAQGSED